jgi:hypothetical protein
MKWGPGKSLDHTLFRTKYYLHASKSATSVKKYDTNIWVSIPVPMKGWLQGLVLSFGPTRVNWPVTEHLHTLRAGQIQDESSVVSDVLAKLEPFLLTHLTHYKL